MENNRDKNKPKINGTIKLTQLSQNRVKFDYELSMDKQDLIKNRMKPTSQLNVCIDISLSMDKDKRIEVIRDQIRNFIIPN